MINESDFYDHYKDTFEQQKGYLKERDRLTLYLILVVAIIFLLSGNRTLLVDASSLIQEQNIGKAIVDFKIITTVLYFVFLWFTMRYYQINLTVEKTYNYIERCEAKLSSASGGLKIDRESGDYEKNYPWLKWLVHRIYVYVFPILVIAAATISIMKECSIDDSNRLLNIVFLSLVIVLSILYLINRAFGK